MTSRTGHRLARLAVSGAATISLLAVTGCGADESQTPSSAEETQASASATADAEPSAEEDVVKLDDVAADLSAYTGEDLTVQGAVKDIITPEVFTIVDPTGKTIDPLLIVGAERIDGLAPEQIVQVTGSVREDFDITEAEETLGIQLDDELLSDWDRGMYIAAEEVDLSENAQG